MSLSIILTCYNEVPTVFESYEQLAAMMERTGIDHEFIVVDDGSVRDKQEQVEDYFQARDGVVLLINDPNRGRGGSVTRGIQAANKDYVGFIDTDLEIQSYSILALYLEALATGADVVLGERVYRVGFGIRDVLRTMFSKAYRAVAAWALPLKGLDTETGCKVFKRETFLPILEGVVDERWFWDTETTAEALRCGLEVVQIPAVVERKPETGSTVHVVRDTLRYLKAIRDYRERLKVAAQEKGES